MAKIDEQTLKDAVARGIPRTGGYVPPAYTSPEELDNDDNDSVESTSKRKGRKGVIDDYRIKYLSKVDVPTRQLIYVSEELHESLTKIVQGIGGKRATLSSYVENILRNHLSEHKELLNSVHKTQYSVPIQW